MKFIVDVDRCENHGQCTYLAGSVFMLEPGVAGVPVGLYCG